MLQNDGVQGRLDSTLQGACENGAASVECRRRAWAFPAIVTAAAAMIRQKTMRRRMTQALKGSPTRGKVRPATAGIKSAPVHIPAFTSKGAALQRLLLHVLDAGKIDALGAFPGVAEIEFVLGEKHRIAVDVVGDAGAVGRYEGLQLLAVIRRDPARQLKFAGLEFDRQRVFGVQPRLQHVKLQ